MTPPQRTDAQELRHCCYSLVGQLDAICSRLPDCPEARVLRGVINGGMPALTSLADAVCGGGGEPPPHAYDRGYQVSALSIQEERDGRRLPREAWHQPPWEFMAELGALAASHG